MMKRNLRHRYPSTPSHRSGVILAIVAFVLVAVIIMGAAAINLSLIDLSNTELRTATDSAARAAAREFSRTGNTTLAINAGISVAAQNQVNGVGLQLTPNQFTFGNASRISANSKYTFQAGVAPTNAVLVAGRRTANSSGGGIALFMGGLLGTTSYDAETSAIAAQAELDIIFVLDRSGSMAFEPQESSSKSIPAAADTNKNGSADPGEWYFGDPPPIPGDSRWEGVLGAMSLFLDRLNQTPSPERVAVVTFNGQTFVTSDFTSSYGTLMSSLSSVSPSGSTAIGNGINHGTTLFNESPYHRQWATRVMIVLTDGQNNAGVAPLTAAEQAAGQGITIHTVSFTPTGSPTLMQQIAQMGGGTYNQASSNAELAAAFDRIVNSLPVLLVE